jgi:hypothetical protein
MKCLHHYEQVKMITSTNPDTLLLDCNEGKKKRSLLLIDVKYKKQRRFIFNIEGHYEILWDNQGYPYMLQGNNLNMIHHRV